MKSPKVCLKCFVSVLLLVGVSVYAQVSSVEIVGDLSNLTIPATVSCHVNIPENTPGQPAHLRVENYLGSFRKLIIGNNPTNLYNPGLNVIGLGNNKLQLKFKDLSGNVNWSKIQIKPNGVGSISIAPYISGGIVGPDGWTTIAIPLSDFPNTIDFKSIKQIFFPYCTDFSNFAIGVASIKFVGSDAIVNYFGEEKTNNIHNGNGGSGEMRAMFVPATLPVNVVSRVDFYINSDLAQSVNAYPFSASLNFPLSGTYQVSAKVNYNDGRIGVTTSKTLTVKPKNVVPISVSIDMADSTILQWPSSVQLKAIVTGAKQTESSCIYVSNSLSGYRKLNIGFNPDNIYNPKVNLSANGNTTIEITLKDSLGTTDWSKVYLKIMELGGVNLDSYVNRVGGIVNDYKTISVPLSEFSDVDLTQVSYITFPYSADAGIFKLCIKNIEIKGGNTPIVWFGDTKKTVSLNGNGGNGELTARIVNPTPPQNALKSVSFILNDSVVYTDYFQPFETNLSQVSVGSYQVKATAEIDQAGIVSSTIKNLIVKPPLVDTISTLGVSINKLLKDTLFEPAKLNIGATISRGYKPIPMHLLASSLKTGFIKSNIGYSPINIYSGGNNVVAGGNTTIAISMKLVSGSPDWNKILLKPFEKGSLTISKYINSAIQEPDGWFTIKIPLSDFDSTIDFTNLSYLSFPYSADAGLFSIAIKQILFEGGSTPFEWFGSTKSNNALSGANGNGELLITKINEFVPVATISKVDFFVNGILKETDVSEPYQMQNSVLTKGKYSIVAKLVDSKNRNAYSLPVSLTVVDDSYHKGVLMTFTFDTIPETINVTKSALKYDKDFAYSFTLDDGGDYAYTMALPFFEGGYVSEVNKNYEGLFFTDGCGNRLSFKAASAFYSVRSYDFKDIHVNSLGYLTWNQLVGLYNSGWDVLNHSYSHSANIAGINYNWEVVQGRDYIKQKSGILTTGFVIPSGDQNYVNAAFNNGYKAIYAYNSNFLGVKGLPVDNPLNFSYFKLFRKYIYDEAFDTSNVCNPIDDIANQCINGNHMWYNDFTHSIRPVASGGLVFSTFEYYMKKVAEKYGERGSDRIWMAPLQEVFEYLKVRDQIGIDYSLDGNVLKIWIDTAGVDKDLRHYVSTLRVIADKPFRIENTNGIRVSSFNGTGAKKLINLDWTPIINSKSGRFGAAKETAEPVKTPIVVTSTVYPNPVVAGGSAILGYSAENDGSILLKIIGTDGKCVLRETKNLHQGLNELELSTKDIKPGLYVVLVDGTIQAKLMVR